MDNYNYKGVIDLLLERVDVDENGVSPKIVSDFDTLVDEYNSLKKMHNNNDYQPKKYTQTREEIKATEFKAILKKQLKKLAENELGQKFLCQIGELLNEDHKLRIKLTNKGSSEYNANSNTIIYSFSNLIAAKCNNETDYFTFKPLIKGRAKIGNEDVVKISNGLSPFYFTIMHELGHYRDYKNNSSKKKIETSIEKQKEKIEIRKKRFSAKQEKSKQTTEQAIKPKILAQQPNKFTSPKKLSTEIENINDWGSKPELAPLDSMKSVTHNSHAKLYDDLLEHKNIFTMDNNKDISELSLRIAMGEPWRYLYQTQKQGTTIYEPIKTVLKKAVKFIDKEEQTKSESFVKKLIYQLKEDNKDLEKNVDAEYMKIKFASYFPDAFENIDKKTRIDFIAHFQKYGIPKRQNDFEKLRNIIQPVNVVETSKETACPIGHRRTNSG